MWCGDSGFIFYGVLDLNVSEGIIFAFGIRVLVVW